MECPGAGLSAGFRVREPAPGTDATFPGKPRNPDRCLHAHASYPAQKGPTSQPWQPSRPRGQSIANATTISPNMPTAMIVLVVASIVGSAGLVHLGRLAALGRLPHAVFRCRRWRSTTERNLFRPKKTCDHPRDIISRDADVLQLPVVQTAELVDGTVALPAADCPQEELRDSHSWRAGHRDTMGGSGWMFDYGHFVPPS